jgi:putative molybdopterin biosynthesis protein
MLLDDAKKLWQEKINEIFSHIKKEEIINIWESQGRISSKPVYANISSPHYNASAMDGIAVKSKDTFLATEKNPILLSYKKQYIYVNTGEMIPENFDAVIMIEDIVEKEDNKVMIIKGATPYQHIRPIGEDIVAKELIIPSKHKIKPVDIGALLAGGHTEIEVYKKPVIGIIPTGNEIIEPSEGFEKGKIIEYNSRIFEGLIKEWGAIGKRYDIVPDNFELIKETILKALAKCDAVIVNAGSSAGSRDYTKEVLRDIGEVLVHGIATKPGKPAILGIVKGKPIIGIPGYPVSAYFVMDFFVKPLIEVYTQYKFKAEKNVKARVSKKIVSSLKHEEYIRVKLGNVGDKLIASPLNRGAGVIMSLVRADGYMIIPKNSEGLEAGEEADVKLFKDFDDILNTLVIIGSHDPMLDVISDMLHNKTSKYSVSSSHVGSMGGIMALMRDEAHLAGIHLLDMGDGSYNTSYVKKYLKNKEIALIHMAGRKQGFMVKPGNPKIIKGFNDLLREDIKFINRQKGSGTRLLLDYYLKNELLDPDAINGYNREEFTHLTTAAAVAEGSADIALGIFSAAVSMNLDFIDICTEQYDLAVPVKYLEMDMIKELAVLIKSEEFKKALIEMGGYDVSKTGEIDIVE